MNMVSNNVTKPFCSREVAKVYFIYFTLVSEPYLWSVGLTFKGSWTSNGFHLFGNTNKYFISEVTTLQLRWYFLYRFLF